MKLTSAQIKNTSLVTGTTITDALNTLRISSGDGTGDMVKVVYDTDNDGKVDSAEVADSVAWAGVSGKPSTFPPTTHNHPIAEITSLQTALDNKQASLVSGTNIKTINGNSILGSGDLVVSGGGGGSGDVVGPSSSVDNNITTFDGVTGKLIKDSGTSISSLATTSQLSSKQDTLVSGTTIKTLNSTSLLGSGDIAVQPVLASGTNIKTINGASVLGSGDLVVTGGSGATIKGIQRGTIAITNGNSSGTATISSVTTAKTEIRFLGGSGYDGSAIYVPRIALTNSTTITATFPSTASGTITVSWELTEWD